VFRPAGTKRHRIAYMPRKWPGLAERLRAEIRQPVEWLPIDGCTEAETAGILAGSSVFLNLGRVEGFGLPPLEAMAAGCVVCGFAGEGTTDFATPENGFWAAENDMGGCLRAIDHALAAFRDPGLVGRYVTAGLQTAERFALPVFEDRVAEYFRALL
jgi:glycosyltransferase involved in cell wall biosynthesis